MINQNSEAKKKKFKAYKKQFRRGGFLETSTNKPVDFRIVNSIFFTAKTNVRK